MGLSIWNGSAYVNATGFSVAANATSWTNSLAQAIWTGSDWNQFFPHVQLIGDTTSSSGTTVNQATLRIKSDGTYEGESSTDGITFTADWILPVAYASSTYEVRATSGGGGATGTFGTWLSLSSNRSWSLSSGLFDELNEDTVFLEIRNTAISSTQVIASATFNLAAIRTSA